MFLVYVPTSLHLPYKSTNSSRYTLLIARPSNKIRGAKLHAYNAGQVVIHTAGDAQKE